MMPNPYLLLGAAAGFALLAAAVWIQTARLDTAQVERGLALLVAEDNRKAAISQKLAKDLADAVGAARLANEQAARAAADAALREYRGTVKGESNACHFAVVDPTVDRLLARPDPGRSPAD